MIVRNDGGGEVDKSVLLVVGAAVAAGDVGTGRRTSGGGGTSISINKVLGDAIAKCKLEPTG